MEEKKVRNFSEMYSNTDFSLFIFLVEVLTSITNMRTKWSSVSICGWIYTCPFLFQLNSKLITASALLKMCYYHCSYSVPLYCLLIHLRSQPLILLNQVTMFSFLSLSPACCHPLCLSLRTFCVSTHSEVVHSSFSYEKKPELLCIPTLTFCCVPCPAFTWSIFFHHGFLLYCLSAELTSPTAIQKWTNWDKMVALMICLMI